MTSFSWMILLMEQIANAANTKGLVYHIINKRTGQLVCTTLLVLLCTFTPLLCRGIEFFSIDATRMLKNSLCVSSDVNKHDKFFPHGVPVFTLNHEHLTSTASDESQFLNSYASALFLAIRERERQNKRMKKLYVNHADICTGNEIIIC